mgnify:CR=1 FL=1
MQNPADGNIIEDRLYDNSDYDYTIIIEDRIQQVATPMICLNSVMEPIISSRTINLTILQSTPVESSLDVVAITGYFSPTEIKYCNLLLP